MNFVNKIKKLSFETKRTLAIILAILLTIIIIILNSTVGYLWKDDSVGDVKSKNDPIKSIQESVSQIINSAKPIIDEAFSSTTKEKIMEQINSASSSTSTTTNVVE